MCGFKSFYKDQRGNFATIFALSMVPIFGIIGAAIDYSRASEVEAKLSEALDAGVLAIGTQPQMSDAEAYKIVQLRRQRWSPLEAFYAITLGNARALGLEGQIGRLEPGLEADMVVLDSRATPAMAHRMERADDLAEELFVLLILGDERAVRATYVMGRRIGDA